MKRFSILFLIIFFPAVLFAETADNLFFSLESMTDLQIKNYCTTNPDMVVRGSGTIMEIREINMFDEVKGTYTIEIDYGNEHHAVIGTDMPSGDLIRFNVGASVYFSGYLASYTDWGFWKTVYLNEGTISK